MGAPNLFGPQSSSQPPTSMSNITARLDSEGTLSGLSTRQSSAPLRRMASIDSEPGQEIVTKSRRRGQRGVRHAIYVEDFLSWRQQVNLQGAKWLLVEPMGTSKWRVVIMYNGPTEKIYKEEWAPIPSQEELYLLRRKPGSFIVRISATDEDLLLFPTKQEIEEEERRLEMELSRVRATKRRMEAVNGDGLDWLEGIVGTDLSRVTTVLTSVCDKLRPREDGDHFLTSTTWAEFQSTRSRVPLGPVGVVCGAEAESEWVIWARLHDPDSKVYVWAPGRPWPPLNAFQTAIVDLRHCDTSSVVNVNPESFPGNLYWFETIPLPITEAVRCLRART